MRIVLGPSCSIRVSAWSLDVDDDAEPTSEGRRVDEEAADDVSADMRSLTSSREGAGSAGEEGAVYGEG